MVCAGTRVWHVARWHWRTSHLGRGRVLSVLLCRVAQPQAGWGSEGGAAVWCVSCVWKSRKTNFAYGTNRQEHSHNASRLAVNLYPPLTVRTVPSAAVQPPRHGLARADGTQHTPPPVVHPRGAPNQVLGGAHARERARTRRVLDQREGRAAALWSRLPSPAAREAAAKPAVCQPEAQQQ